MNDERGSQPLSAIDWGPGEKLLYARGPGEKPTVRPGPQQPTQGRLYERWENPRLRRRWCKIGTCRLLGRFVALRWLLESGRCTYY